MPDPAFDPPGVDGDADFPDLDDSPGPTDADLIAIEREEDARAARSLARPGIDPCSVIHSSPPIISPH